MPAASTKRECPTFVDLAMSLDDESLFVDTNSCAPHAATRRDACSAAVTRAVLRVQHSPRGASRASAVTTRVFSDARA